MDTVLYYVCIPLGILMKWSWQLLGNYGLAIILFTLFTKLILMPVSVWIHKNSISMVKIQPAINFLKVNYYGDLDTFADEQSKLFKKEKYHPMLSLVPLALQIFLLLGVVQIIYHPMEYLISVNSDTLSALASYINVDMADSSYQLKIIEAVKNGTIGAASVIPGVGAAELNEVVSFAGGFQTTFLGVNLSTIPADVWGWYSLMPVVAGLSSWLLCFTQNLSNVIQHEQSKLSQHGMTILSVGISVYLGVCLV